MRYYQFEDQQEYEGNEPIIQDFIRWVYKKLYIPGEPPVIKFSQEKESADQHRTGYYDLDDNFMWIYTGNRNLIDILRTVAHELVHHKQRTDGDTTDNIPVVDLESQADSIAGLIMKIYVRHHPEIIQ